MAEQPRYFDVDYSVSSVALTATGKKVVIASEADYHGLSMVAGTTAKAVITIYDNSSDTTGNLVDLVTVTAGGNVWIDRYKPVKAKNGLTISVVGVGATGVIFYGPKG